MIVVLSSFLCTALAQRGYYKRNNEINTGVRILNDRTMNFRYCQVLDSNRVVRLKPDQVDEYGIDNGPVYKAFNIMINSKPYQYFLERLLKGRFCLYSLNGEGGIQRFYISGSDSTILEQLTRKDYKTVLRKYSDESSNAINSLNTIGYNKADLICFLEEINDATYHPLPKIRLGIRLGVDAVRTSVEDRMSVYSGAKYPTDWNLSTGILLNIPLEMSKYSIIPEINYKAVRNTIVFDNDPYSYALLLDRSSVAIPLFLRYSFSDANVTPYLQAGPLYSRIFRNESILYEYESVSNVVSTIIKESPVLGVNMGGFSLGGGIETRLKGRLSFFGELRYNQLYNLSNVPNNLRFGEYSLMIGIIF